MHLVHDTSIYGLRKNYKLFYIWWQKKHNLNKKKKASFYRKAKQNLGAPNKTAKIKNKERRLTEQPTQTPTHQSSLYRKFSHTKDYTKFIKLFHPTQHYFFFTWTL